MESLALMPSYEAYKDSGVEWLGDIPASWSLLANKHIFRLKKKQVGKRSNEYDLLSLTLRGVIKRDMENPEGKFPAEFDTYQEVRCGDFIFCLFDVEETPRTVGLSPFNGMITGAYTVFEPNDNFDNRFLYYFYLNLDAKKRLKPLYRGLRNTIPKDSFLSFKTFVPPHEQQTLIANFLDKKTAQIDDAIAIKEQQISLLKERKQISIQQAVTQGLDPNVPIKDSGVEWIGEIPEHWDISIAKYILKKLNRPRKQNGDTVICSNHGCSKLLGEVNQGLVSLTQHDYQGVDEGDLLVHGMDAWHGAIAISEHAGDCTSVVHVCDSIFNKAYISYFLKMLAIMNVYKVISNGVRGNTSDFRSWSKFGQVQIILPPMDEQAAIVELLNKQTQDTELAIKMLQNQISALKEYKYTLINSAVTGKIKITPEMVEQ